MVVSSETGKSQLFYNWLKIGTFQPTFDKISFFQHPQPFYDFMQKELENLEFVNGVKFEVIDSLKNNGTEYLQSLAIHVKRFAIQKLLLVLLLLEDIVD